MTPLRPVIEEWREDESPAPLVVVPRSKRREKVGVFFEKSLIEAVICVNDGEPTRFLIARPAGSRSVYVLSAFPLCRMSTQVLITAVAVRPNAGAQA